MQKVMTMTALAVMLVHAGLAAAAPAPELKCQAGKNDAAGKYAACAGKAEKGFAATGDAMDRTAALTKCQGKLVATWDKLEAAAVAALTTCPSMGDQLAIETYVAACTAGVASKVGGGALPLSASVLISSQTICYDTVGTVIECAGTGQDGESQKGVARSFTDNLDGTVTDNKTALMWEKLDDNNAAGIHDMDNTYTWTDAVSVKIASLNSGIFAGHSDWRLPNVRELQTLLDFSAFNPSTFGAFHSGCAPGCTAGACSCTASNLYWTSTTARDSLTGAWYLGFNVGETNGNSKGVALHVRAVRGGAQE